MLVLTRKVAEKLYIGRDICITVVRLDGGQVRLGIEAPREVPVVRAELLLRDAGAPNGHGRAAEADPAPESYPVPTPASEGKPAEAPTPPPTVKAHRPAPLETGIRRRAPSR